MDIKLRHLSLTNFKGIKSKSFDFSDETFIYGDNATGKTTLFDSFTWLLFGKDSADRKDFNIKPLDFVGKSKEKVSCEVSAVLIASGVEMILKRVFQEKWQKVKGAEQPEFVGNETLYYWNDVPMQQKEYMSKIETLLDEQVFKLITNPLYFNSLKWQDRRAALLSIAGHINDSDVLDSISTLSNKQEIMNLTSILNQGKTLAEYKKEIAAKRKKANDDLKMIPSRIDEAERSKPQPENYDAIRASIKRLTGEVAKLDEQISDKARANESRLQLIQSKQNQFYSLKSDLTAIEFRFKEEIRERNRTQDEQPLKIRREISSLELELSTVQTKIDILTRKNAELEASLQPTRDQWASENEKQPVFDDLEMSCPTCKRAYESDDIEESRKILTENFNADKVKRLEVIRNKGIQAKVEIESNNTLIQQRDEEKSEITSKLEAAKKEFQKLATSRNDRQDEKDELKSLLESNSDYAQLLIRINDLQSDLEESNKPDESIPEDSGLKSQKATLSSQIAELNQKLAGEEQIKRTDARIDELKESERSLAQIIAEYEGSEFVIDAFTKSKMNMLEERINSRFKLARFRMFKPQVNGGEEETCDTTFNGVPWSDLNTAGKIQVGIDIINALSEFYSVNAPIWIDNRESTVQIPETDSQIINLIVKGGATLTVHSGASKFQTA
ncbi:AAA family ATPase [Dyadobacter bucti]|uniref:AAA family ATPase n=1 Tax=Dyadobacter bucti TaxID=2572203 RepID=UPI001107C25C|nr:AAA family ATPase [Dyadobacter bucti]